MTKSSCSRTSGEPSEEEKYWLQRKQQINTFQTFITVSGKMISVRIPRINKRRQKPKDLHLQLWVMGVVRGLNLPLHWGV